MNHIFNSIDKFFASLNSYIGLGESFVIFVGLFLLVVLISFISTSRSYESKLIKAIDMLNGYFVNNPKITEDNLVLFNQIMRHKKVPKLLRKHWQQFMLYRENTASFYMSFENCVAIPLRNSKFKRDKVIMNLFAYILAGASLILNTYLTAETADVAFALQRIFLAPVIILLLNFIASIILDLKESAIINDLNQNYQYFETNIDKATKTLPEYVDYEILFEKQEIKKGIPILYQYLQKRAEEEQRELELARLKNVEHEKFNFDEAGLAGSLVLERAMQEAENYIAERKKYNEDIAQINSEIAQEDINYREITKEYNRQMQVSKETFANFKQQLEQATSTIEANYLKKQQQQELDRQRNLERDFDTATDRHKKVIESYQAELDSIDKFIAESRKSLEDAMMAEFATYSGKVYDEAKKVVNEREKEKYAKIKQEVKDLEEQLYAKNKEIEINNSELNEVVDKKVKPNKKAKFESEKVDVVKSDEPVENIAEEQFNDENNLQEFANLATEAEDNFNLEENKVEDNNSWNESSDDSSSSEWDFGTEEKPEETNDSGIMSLADFDKQNNQDTGTQSYSDYLKSENLGEFKFDPNAENVEDSKPNDQDENDDSDEDWFNEDFVESTIQEGESAQEGENVEKNSSDEDDDEDDDFSWFDEILNESEEDEESEEVDENLEEDEKTETDEDETDEDGSLEIKPEPEDEKVIVKKKAGRPRKVVAEGEDKPKRKPGRPRKVETETKKETTAKKRGRPRKIESADNSEQKRKPGRPKKVENSTNAIEKPAARRGRPKKVTTSVVEKEDGRRPGRPKKKKAGRPRKVAQDSATETKPKKKVGRPKKERQGVENKPAKRKAGRPKKVDLNAVDGDVDLEAYLKVIDNAIAKENAKIKRSQRALENNANIKTKKKK